MVAAVLRPKEAPADALRERLADVTRQREETEARLRELDRSLRVAAVDAPRRAEAIEREITDAAASLRRLRLAEEELRDRLAEADRREAVEALRREAAEAAERVEAAAARIREEYPELARKLADLAREEAEARAQAARVRARVSQAELEGRVAPGEIVAAWREPFDFYRGEAAVLRVALCEVLRLPDHRDPAAGRPFWPA